MAGTRDLRSRRRWVPLAGLVLGVLVLHWIALRWVAQHTAFPSALRSMPEAMFTRVLAPEAPPPPPETPAMTAAPPAPARPAITTLQAPAAAQPAATPPAVAETPAAAEPEPTPEPEPAPPTEIAKAPTPPPPTESAATEPPAAAAPPLPDPAVVDPQASASLAPDSGVGNDVTARDHWPRDSRVSYALTGQFRGPLYGNAQVQWQREGPRYQARVTLEISLAGTRTLTSQGEVTPTGLMPRVYEETWRGRRRNVRMDERELVFESGATAPRPGGVQDTASQFVELGWRFASGRERMEVGRAVEVWLARPGAVDLWTYDIVGREVLATPKLGAVEAFRLKPRPIARPRGNITAEIWFAPSLQYLPARIRVTLGDEAWVDLMVESVEQR